MKFRKFLPEAIVTALLVGTAAVGTATYAHAEGPKGGATAFGELHPGTAFSWCLTYPHRRDGAIVTIQHCTGAPGQLWGMSRYHAFLTIGTASGGLCLGVARSGWTAVLQDCATENAHGALLRYGQIGGGAYAAIKLLNGRILAAPAALRPGNDYNATWRNDPKNGHFTFEWRFPKWEDR